MGCRNPSPRLPNFHTLLRLLAHYFANTTYLSIRASVRAYPHLPTKKFEFRKQLTAARKLEESPGQVSLGPRPAGRGPAPLDLSSQKPHVAGVGPQATCSHRFVSPAIHWGHRRQSEQADPGWRTSVRVRLPGQGAGREEALRWEGASGGRGLGTGSARLEF